MKKKLLRNKTILFGLVVLILTILIGIFAPWILPYPYDKTNVLVKLRPPSTNHFFGTDQFGRDIFSRVIYGTRVSLQVGVFATGVAMLVGTILGVASGYYGGWIDTIVMRLMDLWMSFPTLILAIVLSAALGQEFRNVIIAVGLVWVPQFARVARVSVLNVRNLEYIEAARAIGRSNISIIIRHVFPNIIGPIVVLASLSMATAINAEASLSFLGLGVQPPIPSWGGMLADGRAYMLDAPWIATIPGLAVTLTILSYNLLGDGLRDLLDPRFKGMM